MKFTIFGVFLLVPTLGVKSVCDTDIIIKINSIWGDDAPAGILDELVGTMSYLYIPQVLKNNTKLKCVKTVLEENSKSAEDYHMYEDDVKIIKYQMIENKLNITRSGTDNSSSDDYVFPVYFKNSVFGFWQCRDDYESFINIGVLNYLTGKEEEEVVKAIAEANAELSRLGLAFPPAGEC